MTTLKPNTIEDTSIEEVKFTDAVKTKLNKDLGIPEAPIDGHTYIRQNGAWVAID